MKHILAIDEGTTGATCLMIGEDGGVAGRGYREIPQHFPRAGWVEHDAVEILECVRGAARDAMRAAGADPVAVGITNQRETTVLWDRATGVPIHNAIVWQDTRTAEVVGEIAGSAGQDRFRDLCGLPLATYFSGPKIRWILDNVEGTRERAEAGELLFGNIDTWVIWNITGGPDGCVHVTDVTNASRTTEHASHWQICAAPGARAK